MLLAVEPFEFVNAFVTTQLPERSALLVLEERRRLNQRAEQIHIGMAGQEPVCRGGTRQNRKQLEVEKVERCAADRRHLERRALDRKNARRAGSGSRVHCLEIARLDIFEILAR